MKKYEQNVTPDLGWRRATMIAALVERYRADLEDGEPENIFGGERYWQLRQEAIDERTAALEDWDDEDLIEDWEVIRDEAITDRLKHYTTELENETDASLASRCKDAHITDAELGDAANENRERIAELQASIARQQQELHRLTCQ